MNNKGTMKEIVYVYMCVCGMQKGLCNELLCM